jgi:outer membrane receptor protein involved in Fe transport
MKKSAYRASTSLATMALLFAAATPVFAQDAAKDAAQAADAGLEEIVVTAVANPSSKFKSSVSVSTLNAEQILQSAPRSAAEVLRNIPGIRSEASGGEGNANIAVRGLPVAAGGGKFVQLQEDGLAILEFGDIAFGNTDIFLRADSNIAKIEAIRGGSASTLVSNAPGGVINFISKTGKTEGGSFTFTRGLDNNTTRGDFEYGARINEGLFFHVGGFYRQGSGPRDCGFTCEKGGQIKANVTKEFDKGYVRLYFKYLNDRTPGFLPQPVLLSGTNAKPKIEKIANFSANGDSIHSPYFITNLGLDGSNNIRRSDIADGVHPVSKSFDAEINFEVVPGITLNNKFKIAATSGGFNSPFAASAASAQEQANGILSSARDIRTPRLNPATGLPVLGADGMVVTDQVPQTGAILTYATGPNAGQVITNPGGLNGNGLAQNIVLFDTKINDLGNFANDLKLSGSFETGSGKISLSGGYYKASQKIDTTWLWTSYLADVTGNNTALLNVTDPVGNRLLTENGVVGYGATFFGGCCRRNYDAKYGVDALYVTAGFETDQLNVDGSIRYDSVQASGTFTGDGPTVTRDVNGDGVISRPDTLTTILPLGSPQSINYKVNYLSYSLGANYAISDAVAVFARYSRGGRTNADRLLFGPNILAGGGLRSKDPAVDFVRQAELGVKFRADGFSIFGTGFYAKTEEQNFEATTQRFIDRTYDAKGVELEAAYQLNGINLSAGVTWTNAKIKADLLNPGVVGKKPRRQANFIFQGTAAYTNDMFSVGANLIGTTSSFAQDDNQLKLPGYAQVNAFANFNVLENLTVGVNVNNLFNTVGLTEAEEGSIPANGIIRARSISGRTVAASIKYAF